MKNKSEFYAIYFATLEKQGFKLKRSESADYIADIYYKNQLVVFYTRKDVVEKNPFIDVKPNMIDKMNELARSCALKAGICMECPYDEEKTKLPDGSYQLSEYNNVLLTCKKHNLFGYVFATYRLSPEKQITQRQFFYDKEEALQNFATRSGIVDEKRLFTETELQIFHSNLIKMMITHDGEISKDSIRAVKTLVEKIEDIYPELGRKGNEFDFSKEFDHVNEGYEIGDDE